MKADNLIEVLQRHVRATPDKLALSFGSQHFTYADLDRRSNQVARALVRAGIGRGTRIAIVTKNTPAQLDVWWGAMKAGAVLVLINYRLSARELAYIVNDATAEMLFVGKDVQETVAKAQPQMPGLKQVVALDGGHAPWPSLADLRDGEDGAPLALQVARGDICLQIYTSGTTGHPKGVLTSHANILADLARCETTGLWTDADRLLLCMPMCHIGGTGITIRSIHFGMHIELMREFDAREVIRLLVERRITKAVFVPAMLHMLLETPGCREADFSALDLILYGAGAMPYELMLRVLEVFPCRFTTAFGMTETNGGVTYLSPEDHVGPRARELLKSCGRPAAGVQMRIVDASGQDVPPGTVGEILVRSEQVTSGYYRLPEETTKAFQDGWLRTGDAGHFDAQGYLFISDRLKDMISSGSLKIFPREVEEVFVEHPAVNEVAVIGVPDPRWSEVPMAFVVKKPGKVVSAEELLAFAAERLAKFKLPRQVEFVEALPRTTSGKVLKRELRKPYWQGRDRQV